MESVNQDSVIDAIKKRHPVLLTYEADENGKGGGGRMVQPVAYGLSKAGNPVVRAFQPYGDTTTKVPHWKLFRLDKIKEWKAYKNNKFQLPDGYNRNGDDGMSEVYITSNYDVSRYEKSGLKRYNDERHSKAVEKDPFHDFKRNIKRSIDGMNFDYIRKNVENWQKSKAAQEFRGNGSSVYDMSVANNFGDDNTTETTGVVMKGNNQASNDNTQKYEPDYSKALMNGPVYKGDEAKRVGNDDAEQPDNDTNKEMTKTDNDE